jgi:hypothetical protein
VKEWEDLDDIYDDGFVVHPQPWLTDIEFDGDVLVLGFRDRMGDLLGVKTYPPKPIVDRRCAGNLCSAISAGDILRAAPVLTDQWDIENNASLQTDPLQTSDGAGNGQGPGGGEFYYEESFALGGGQRPRHNETAQGGLAQLPDVVSVSPDVSSEIATTAFNPVPIDDDINRFDGGIIWLQNTTGTRARSFRVYDGESDPDTTGNLLGKNNGLGDLEAFCSPSP